MNDQQPTILVMEGLDGKLRVSPPLFMNNQVKTDLSDLSQFAPHRNGVYGFQPGIPNPIVIAPPQDEIGGFLYFGNGVTQDDFYALMRITGVQEAYVKNPSKQYAVFLQQSGQPGKDGYLSQMRLVSRFALSSLFRVISHEQFETYPEQELTEREAMWGFMQTEKKKYGTSFDSQELDGKFGGDGDFAREELSFGFMVENNYFGVYRIWSRAWLVAK